MSDEIREKLRTAERLQNDISYIKDFLRLIEEGQLSARKGYRRDNQFERLKLTSDICTGDSSHDVEITISNSETIKKCLNAMKPVLEEILKNNICMLENMFK